MDGTKDNIFKELERIKGLTRAGIEFWRARELQEILGYQRWDRFEDVISRAKMACESTGFATENHFAATGYMVSLGSGASREVPDYFLTRYACYLITMNGNPSIPAIGFAQTYFAYQTRRQEIKDQLTGQDARLHIRERVRYANKALNSAAKEAGVTKYPFFHDAGYKGLYDGLGNRDIKRRKGIPDREELLDRAGRAELAANEFRITQTEEKLRKEGIRGQVEAEQVHHHVGRSVRDTISKLGGTMPEDLLPEPSIKKFLSKKKKIKKLPPTN